MMLDGVRNWFLQLHFDWENTFYLCNIHCFYHTLPPVQSDTCPTAKDN